MTAGFTMGSIGSLGETAPDLVISEEMRSFSPSAPIFDRGNWESRKEWMSNGLDRGKPPTRNRLNCENWSSVRLRKCVESKVVRNLSRNVERELNEGWLRCSEAPASCYKAE